MDSFLFHHDNYYRMYNCSLYNVDIISVNQRRRPLLGYALITLGVIAWVAYIPCLAIIWRMRKRSCYKLMTILGCVDVFAMPVVAVSTGFLGTQGAVFCTSPTVIYLLGNIIMGTWIFHSLIALLLAITRCMAVFHSQMMIKLFGGNKPYFWAIPAFLYAMYFVLFTKTPLFSSLGFSWFFNPHFGYIPDTQNEYHSFEHAYHNMFICISTVIVYLTFGILMCRNWTHASKRFTVSQHRVFLQVFLISFCTAITSATYVFMNFSFTPKILSVISSYTYFGIHGVPPFIYLCLNESIKFRLQTRFLVKSESSTNRISLSQRNKCINNRFKKISFQKQVGRRL